MTNREKVLAILFADEKYKAEAGFFVTSDDQCFREANENDAKNHAKSLEGKSLEWYDRKTPSVAKSAKKAKQGAKVEATKDESEDEVEEEETEEEKS